MAPGGEDEPDGQCKRYLLPLAAPLTTLWRLSFYLQNEYQALQDVPWDEISDGSRLLVLRTYSVAVAPLSANNLPKTAA